MIPCGKTLGHGLACEKNYLCDSCIRIDALEKELVKKKSTRLHSDLVQAENDKLRKLLSRSYDMIGELMPGIGGLVVDIGELNSLMISLKLHMDTPPPAKPIKSQRIFGGG